jgi:hypothetical protein
MQAVLTGLIGVAGALLGSLTTYLFQNRAAERLQAFEREERRRQEQVDACTGFAAAVTELKRGLVTLRFQSQHDPRGEEARKAHVECDRLGAATETARFRVQLVCGNPELVNLADAAFQATAGLASPPSLKELHTAESQFEAAVKAFIGTAARRLPAASAQPGRRPE